LPTPATRLRRRKTKNNAVNSGQPTLAGVDDLPGVLSSGEPTFERKLEQEPKTVGAARIIPYIEFRNITQKNGIITTNP
jgi:hypothetical protein